MLFSSALYSQSILSNKRVAKQVLKGLDETFKFNFDKSEKIFDDLIEKYPESPVGYHFKSIPYLWRFLDNKNDSDLVTFEALSDSAIDKSLVVLEETPNDPYTFYLLGSAYSFRAMASARKMSYLDVVWSTKKSYSYLNDVLAIDSTFYDAYLGLGLYNFMVAQTPPALKWAMDITGISGDADIGIEYLKLASEKGRFSKVGAEFYLSQVVSEFYEDYGQAYKLLSKLNKKYKKNMLFGYSLALLQVKMKKLNDAEKTLKYVFTNADTSFNQLLTYSNLLLGNIHFYKNEFDTAKYFYAGFINNTQENFFKGFAAFRLGLCCTFTGDSLEAKKYFELSGEGNTDIDDDRYAEVMGEKFEENPPDSFQLKIFTLKNYIDAGNYSAAYDSLINIIDTSDSTAPALAELNLLLSDVYYYLDSLEQSYNYAIKAADFEDAEKWIKPFAYYNAARASFNLGNYDESEALIEKVEEFRDYFYENDLNNSINALRHRLKTIKN